MLSPLPAEVLLVIAEHLEVRDLTTLLLVNTFFHSIFVAPAHQCVEAVSRQEPCVFPPLAMEKYAKHVQSINIRPHHSDVCKNVPEHSPIYVKLVRLYATSARVYHLVHEEDLYPPSGKAPTIPERSMRTSSAGRKGLNQLAASYEASARKPLSSQKQRYQAAARLVTCKVRPRLSSASSCSCHRRGHSSPAWLTLSITPPALATTGSSPSSPQACFSNLHRRVRNLLPPSFNTQESRGMACLTPRASTLSPTRFSKDLERF